MANFGKKSGPRSRRSRPSREVLAQGNGVKHRVNREDDVPPGSGAFATEVAGATSKDPAGDVEKEQVGSGNPSKGQEVEGGVKYGFEGPAVGNGRGEDVLVRHDERQQDDQRDANLLEEPTEAVQEQGNPRHVFPPGQGIRPIVIY